MNCLQSLSEGEIKIIVPKGKVSREDLVFYNPRKKIDRDISIFVLKCLNLKDFVALDMLSASGIYGLRIASELNPKKVYLNDKNPMAFEFIKRNIEINKEKLKCEVFALNLDARKFFIDEEFDYIDIDPFGSPIKFLPAALSFIKNKGIISITATDTGALYGTYPKACFRKYFAKPLKCKEAHEIGLRILIKRVCEIASAFNFGIEVIFSYWYQHFYRVFFRVKRGSKNVRKSLEKIKLLRFENGWIFEDIWEGKGFGPVWSGKIWEEDIARRVGEQFKELKELSEEYKISTEENIFYDLHGLAKRFKINKIKRKREIIERIEKSGFLATETIFSKTGIRTNADFKILEEVILKN